MKLRLASISLALALGFSFACSDDEKSTNNANTANNVNNANAENSTNNVNSVNSLNNTNNADMGPLTADRECDSLVDSYCSLPFPSNVFLVEDDARETGVSLTFGATSLPPTRKGEHINPEPYLRRDGYGLGAPAIAIFPNLDASGFPNEYNVADSLAEDAKIAFLEIDASGNARKVPYYVDYDLNTTDLEKRPIIVRPAEILKPGMRYAVAFRNLQDTDGNAIAPTSAFQNLLDGTSEAESNLFYRQARFDDLFGILDGLGWAKDSLTLAWDWNTASRESLVGDMLHIRDEAFMMAKQMGPALTITEVEEFTVEENADTRFRIRGTFEAPNYMLPADEKGFIAMRFGEDGLPEPEGTRSVEFWVNVPHSAVGGNDHGLVMYGHGLLGSGRRAWADFNSRIANQHDLIFYGADLWGMSEVQEQDAVRAVTGLSGFTNISDQLHQGMMEWLLLARAMKFRFAALDEVTSRQISVNSDEMFYSGISQGGIFGPTFVALSPEVKYGHAGVPGHTYAVLLHRSVDFEEFFQVMRLEYPDTVNQLIALHTIQLLWDSTDSVSYMDALSANPFDEGDSNAMLFAPAKGDFQVAVHQNELLARTAGLDIALMENYDTERAVDLVTESAYPHTGSAVVLYDFEENYMSNMFRNSWPAPGNMPPTRGEAMCEASCPVGESIERASYECCESGCCFDAHELPRRRDWHNEQMVHFFRNNGEVIDVCGGDGCTPQ